MLVFVDGCCYQFFSPSGYESNCPSMIIKLNLKSNWKCSVHSVIKLSSCAKSVHLLLYKTCRVGEIILY